jgi:hypothetical protein
MSHYQNPASYLRRWVAVDADPLQSTSRASTPASWSTPPRAWRSGSYWAWSFCSTV